MTCIATHAILPITYGNTFYTEVYVKFDGLMYPQLDHNKMKELQSKEESKHSSWSFTGILSKIKSYMVPSGEVKPKYLHAPLALRIYLANHQRFLTGKVDLNKNPVEVIMDIVYIFNSLYKAYLHIDDNCRLLPNNSDIQKVWLLTV